MTKKRKNPQDDKIRHSERSEESLLRPVILSEAKNLINLNNLRDPSVISLPQDDKKKKNPQDDRKRKALRMTKKRKNPQDDKKKKTPQDDKKEKPYG